MNPLESTSISWLLIDSLPIFLMSLIISIIQVFPFIKESVSVHHPLICNGLKILPQCTSQYRWWYIFSSVHECNTGNKTIRNKI